MARVHVTERHPEIVVYSEDEGRTVSGAVVVTHNDGHCPLRYCAIHRPSAHHLVGAPLQWREGTGRMERICGHGIAHPDEDFLDWVQARRGLLEAAVAGVHDCDGCCGDPDTSR